MLFVIFVFQDKLLYFNNSLQKLLYFNNSLGFWLFTNTRNVMYTGGTRKSIN